ncbi:hypothetical protein BFS06_11520 [Clostridium perfringens]|uniref:Putative CopG transcriptional repressor n=1 Tax=Clostridium perfringens TaxID=1502 RepID=A0A140GS11_CLOPF|nr:ribbon-helix-helix protein, CopG family [Clostridium perfringens]AMN31320.1 putative CopG transcriptional repressor [Clostridium perfringens]TBX14843.1 hypothetical protein BFS06_11520 [Clostridium perfringens]
MDKNNKFTLNDEAYAKIQLIAKKEGRTEEEVVRRALSLYTTIKLKNGIDNNKVYIEDEKGNKYLIRI